MPPDVHGPGLVKVASVESSPMAYYPSRSRNIETEDHHTGDGSLCMYVIITDARLLHTPFVPFTTLYLL